MEELPIVPRRLNIVSQRMREDANQLCDLRMLRTNSFCMPRNSPGCVTTVSNIFTKIVDELEGKLEKNEHRSDIVTI